MQKQTPRPASPLRAPLAGVSALLVFGLLLSATLRPAGPAVETRRDTPVERAAVRELTATAVKASRQVVGSDSHKPCARANASAIIGVSDLHPRVVRVADALCPRPALLRAAILDLPPPASLA